MTTMVHTYAAAILAASGFWLGIACGVMVTMMVRWCRKDSL